MNLKRSSYQTIISYLVCLMLFFSAQAYTAEIYLDPDPTYLTGTIGEEFQMELKVDANTLGLRLFQVYIKFESNYLDTVSSELGPLFDLSGFSKYYNMKLVYDTVTADSILKVEGLLLGPNSVVDGPGTVAIINFKTTAPGIVDMSILDHTLTDVNNDTIPSTSVGATIYINTPPDDFLLLTPTEGAVINKFPGDSVFCSWESSQSPYPGENVLYDFEYSDDNTFPSPNTITVTGLTDTFYYIPVDDLDNGFVFWRVRAVGDIYAYSQSSTPYPGYFDFSFSTAEPNAFDLIGPPSSLLENLNGDDEILFDWEDALPGSPGDIIEYTFYVGETMTFPSTPLLEITSGTSSELAVSSDLLPICDEVFWTVQAKNQIDLSTWANSIFSITFMRRGDVDCSNVIDISDIVWIVEYMFSSGPQPIQFETGDLNCDTFIDIADLVFLVSYSFSGGPPPTCDY